jgi:outer membrane protein TolC
MSIRLWAGRWWSAPTPLRRLSFCRLVEPARARSWLPVSSVLAVACVCRVALASEPAATAALEQQLAREASLPAMLRVALAHNPGLAEAEHLERAAAEVAPAAARLPDPQLEYQLWAQPLRRPLALDRAEMHMFGLRQAFPAPGSLSAAGAAASAEADAARASRLGRELDLVAQVRRANADYRRADAELGLHERHVALAEQALALQRARYAGASGGQREVLRMQLELARLHDDVATLARDRATARAMLNVAMGREPEAALGPPQRLDAAELEARAAVLDPRRDPGVPGPDPRPDPHRPELVAAEAGVRARQHDLDAARAAQRWPAFMLGVQYMYAPTEPEPHGYGVVVSADVPWLNPRHGEEVRAAEARLSARESALSSARLGARYELLEARERLRAARASLDIIERQLLPRTQQGIDSAQAAYRAGGDALAYFEALRAELDVQIERERALARLDTALADLERATGSHLPLPTGAGAHVPR